MKSPRAFTLIELLVVLAILAVLAGILFPVFVQAKAAAVKSVCFSNHKQAFQAVGLYVNDYDDRFMPVSYNQDNPNSKNDRTWVQTLMPYANNFDIFRCPGDPHQRDEIEATFDQDQVPGDTVSKYYQASKRSNLGYNYLYLAPVSRAGSSWLTTTRYYTEVQNPGDTYLFVDTVNSRHQDGTPYGGGNYVVIPPCRYQKVEGFTQDTFSGAAGQGPEVFAPNHGWDARSATSAYQFGGAWAWHINSITVMSVAGNARPMRTSQLVQGCRVEDSWAGIIDNPANYAWSSHFRLGSNF